MEPSKEMFDKIKDAIKERDNDKIKKTIDSFHPADAAYDDIKVKEQRTEVFKYALSVGDFPVVEMLYDYWIGDLHWIGHDINKLKTLGQLLKDARIVCDDENLQLEVDIHSLITFNAFQQTLYSKISVLPKTTPKETADMLEKVLRLYETYSDLEKVRIPHEDDEQERKLKADFADKTSDYGKGLAHIMYEVYFRKLGLNVALLILENLYVIRQDLKNKFTSSKDEDEAEKYNEIECALYHFIYRTAEDWRLYLPQKRQITTLTLEMGIQKNEVINYTVKYDNDKLFNGPVLFLERKYFNKNLKELRNILEKHINSILDHDSKQEDTYLTPTYTSDYYSLSKIVYYIGALKDTAITDNNDILMIERVLQVTGEMVKNSDETNHLLESTKALLEIGIPVKTIRYLQDIRNYLTKAYRGHDHLNKRINIGKNQPDIFNAVKKDLIKIKGIFNSIRDIYKPILDKSCLEEGLRLLEERIENLSHETGRHCEFIHRNYKGPATRTDFFFQELSASTGLTIQLLKEFYSLLDNKNDIESKINNVEITISKRVANILPTYIQNIRQSLELIAENQSNVSELNSQLTQYKIRLSDNPNQDQICNTARSVQRIKKRYKNCNDDLILQTLRKIEDFTQRWKAIKTMLSFFLINGEFFAPKLPKRHLPEDLDVHTITNKLTELEGKIKFSSTSKQNLDKHSFDGIKTLREIFKEKDAVSTQNNNSKQTLARVTLIQCLIDRIDLLKIILPNNSVLSDRLVQRYKTDLKFRFGLEMILADIANILANCGIKELMNKSSKLLRNIDLGNVLDHGNPFLEVIGDIFDSYDLSTALLSKAIMFAKDGESIEALLELFKDKVDYETIKEEKLGKMNNDQKNHYTQFQRSPRWVSYVELVPNPNKKSA